MPSDVLFPLVAVDAGNYRLKCGLFEPKTSLLRRPGRQLALRADGTDLNQLGAWLDSRNPSEVAWYVASVNRRAAGQLVDWLREDERPAAVTLLSSGDLPLQVDLPRPDMVGIDRLLDAVAANALRAPDRPAIIVDAGTAITVDVVSADGVFQGGAIAAGMGLSARGLHEFTDMLPLIDVENWAEPPCPHGAATAEAMQAGLFWGTVGAIRELVAKSTTAVGPQQPEVFLTGGTAAAIAKVLPSYRRIDHLTLLGIAIAARKMQ